GRERIPETREIFFFQAEDGIRDRTVTGSSDVCSSDLADEARNESRAVNEQPERKQPQSPENFCDELAVVVKTQEKHPQRVALWRSEERRVGKECRCGGSESC